MKKKLIRNTKQTCEYKQEKIVKFFWEQTDEIFVGKNLVCYDNSIVFLPNVDSGPFDLYLYGWKIFIATGSIGVNHFRYLSGYFLKDEVILSNLNIPKSIKGIVKFKTDFEIFHGIYYNDFFPFVQNMYYDKDTQWLALGDINCVGNAIEFATNNIAVINENNDLVAIYVKLFKE